MPLQSGIFFARPLSPRPAANCYASRYEESDTMVTLMRRFVHCGLLLLLLAACAEDPPPPPMVEVVVDAAVTRPYQPRASFVGRLHAQDDVSIQARVSGYLLSRNFVEGDYVLAGDLLYEIDPAELEAQEARAKADLAKARANQAVADRNYNRGSELLPDGNISASEMDRLTASKLEADAGVESAKAQLKTAEVNLAYTRILAPISGRIGRSNFSPGDLIGPDSGPLTTLVSIDPIQALFQISEATLVGAVADRMHENARNLNDIDFSDLTVKLELSNRSQFSETGYIDYFSNRVSETTGTLEARALVPNPRGVLLPGQYVRVILERTEEVDALFVPQAAVQADQQGSFVLVVVGGVVQRHNVVLGERVDEYVVVTQGLEEGEQIIVRGLQQVRPGQPVTVRAMPGSGS
jgi:membrane fusion protein (multidrug efflux system)